MCFDENTSRFEVKSIQAVVIGSGISGLFTALKLSEAGMQVLILTKNALAENNSRYAQGGIAAVLPENSKDSLELHVQDTLNVGADLCEEEVVREILGAGHQAISELLLMGVPFDKNEFGEIELTLEAGHSVRRILHAGGDATGKQVEMTLVNKVHADPNIEVIEDCEVSELLSEDGKCYGCRAIIYNEQKELIILSAYTILATGGLGRLFSQSTNPAGATGNGFSLAYKAEALLHDMEFVQFHPTAFFKDGNAHFLLSEALRGEGGILRNAQGEAFTQHYHPKGDLAPRDVVTRAIYCEIKKNKIKEQNKEQEEQQTEALAKPHVYLDITHLPNEKIEKRFPTILKTCEQFGIDIRKEWIPVAPAAHYIMGGVEVDLNGRTTVERLFIVGETVWTGLHGGNRLASNSLLECVVLARHCAQEIGKEFKPEAEPASSPSLSFEPTAYLFDTPQGLAEDVDALHQLMWQYVGIIRTENGLKQGLIEIEALKQRADIKNYKDYAPLGIDYVNQLLLARLMTEAALAREESRGAHYREDFPEKLKIASHSTQARHLNAEKTGVLKSVELKTIPAGA